MAGELQLALPWALTAGDANTTPLFLSSTLPVGVGLPDGKPIVVSIDQFAPNSTGVAGVVRLVVELIFGTSNRGKD